MTRLTHQWLFFTSASLQVESELRRLALLYAVYAEHAEAVRQYSGMLWSELDVGNMMDGVQGVATKLKKLKGFESMPVYELVQAEIAGFADSLPLMKELKSDSLRLVVDVDRTCMSMPLFRFCQQCTANHAGNTSPTRCASRPVYPAAPALPCVT